MDLELKNYSEKPFNFTGKSLEFFGIWIVNIALTILTLGIYSAWAKVRTNRYFYGNTQVDGSAFEYLAEPKQILKSRVIASLLFAAYYTINNIYPLWGLGIAGFIALLIPAIIVLSMSFRMRNSAYRGITFRFQRDFKGAYLIYGLPVLLFVLLLGGTIYSAFPSEVWDAAPSDEAVVEQQNGVEQQISDIETIESSIEQLASGAEHLPHSDEYAEGDKDEFTPPWAMIALFPLFFLAFPFWEYLKARFLISNTRYGTSPFDFTASAGNFYFLYLKAIIIFIVAIALVGFVSTQLDIFTPSEEGTIEALSPSLIAMQVSFFIFYLWAFAYIQTKRSNLIFSQTELNGMPLQSTLSVTYMLYLYVTNTLGIVCSLGLLIPWSMIRTARYRASQLCLLSNTSLDDFIADQQKELSAFGEEFGDAFDIEIGI